MMDLSLRVLRYVVAAAEHGSATAAARALHVSQPSISLAIAQVETSLNVQLFVRQRARGVAPTPAGTAVLREARKLLANANDFMATVADLGGSPRGTLQIGCLSYLAPRFLGGLLASFGKRYPGVEIGLREGDQDQLLAWMRNGEIELALTYDLLFSDRFVVEPLLELPPYVLVPDSHRLARRTAIHLRQIIEEPCVLLDLPISQEYFASLFDSLGLRPVVHYRSRSVEAVRSFVGNGLGYSILNQATTTAVTYDGMRVRPLALLDDLRPARMVMARLAEVRLRTVAENFVDHCRDAFAAMRVQSGKGMRKALSTTVYSE
jgi:DNA-binding transcriptional LysR family regulator